MLRGCLTYQNYNHYYSADASLLEAIGMFDLGLGVSHVSDILPLPVCALLSLLNPSVVGVTPFAAAQLTEKAITDLLSRLMVVFSPCAGLRYNVLWYFPILMAVAPALLYGIYGPEVWLEN